MKKQTLMVGAVSFALGAALFGGGAAYAAGVMAERSTSPVYVDGQRVALEAYNINGANYVKLRDVGQAVGFNVYWNGAAVQVESDKPYTGEAPTGGAAAKAGTVTIPQTDALFLLHEGDTVLCDDGTTYTVTDMSRYDNNVFASGKLPPLPTATCNWSLFPATELPKAETRHYSDDAGDDLFIRNLYETRRMEYTICNALGNEPEAWNGDEPLAKIYLTIPAEYAAYASNFYPWRASELVDLVHSVPDVRFYVEAWDYFHNGVYMHTRYCVFAI